VWTLLEIGQRNGANRPDVILMEASGLADPIVMLDAITVAHLLPLVRLGALISVVDSARFMLMPPETIPLMFRQIVLADFIVQNKTDIAYKSHHREMHADVTKELREVNATAPIYATKGGAFDMTDLWTRVQDDNAIQRVLDADSPHARTAPHAHFNTMTIPLSGAVSREKFEAVIAALERNVWRVKGFVRFENDDNLHLIQYVGAALYAKPHLDISQFGIPIPKGEKAPQTTLVCIGPGLDREGLMQRFEATQIAPTSTRLPMLVG